MGDRLAGDNGRRDVVGLEDGRVNDGPLQQELTDELRVAGIAILTKH